MTKERYNALLEEVSMLLFSTMLKNYPFPPIQTEEVMRVCAAKAKAFIDEIENLSRQ